MLPFRFSPNIQVGGPRPLKELASGFDETRLERTMVARVHRFLRAYRVPGAV